MLCCCPGGVAVRPHDDRTPARHSHRHAIAEGFVAAGRVDDLRAETTCSSMPHHTSVLSTATRECKVLSCSRGLREGDDPKYEVKHLGTQALNLAWLRASSSSRPPVMPNGRLSFPVACAP